MGGQHSTLREELIELDLTGEGQFALADLRQLIEVNAEIFGEGPAKAADEWIETVMDGDEEGQVMMEDVIQSDEFADLVQATQGDLEDVIADLNLRIEQREVEEVEEIVEEEGEEVEPAAEDEAAPAEEEEEVPEPPAEPEAEPEVEEQPEPEPEVEEQPEPEAEPEAEVEEQAEPEPEEEPEAEAEEEVAAEPEEEEAEVEAEVEEVEEEQPEAEVEEAAEVEEQQERGLPEEEEEPEAEDEAEAEVEAVEEEEEEQIPPPEPRSEGGSRFTDEALQASFDLFDYDRKGKVGHEDLRLIMEGYGVRGLLLDQEDDYTFEDFKGFVESYTPAPSSVEEIRAAFGSFDVTGAGSLSVADIYESMCLIDPRVTEDEVAEVVRYCAVSEGSAGESLTVDDFTQASIDVDELPRRLKQRYGVVELE